MYMSDEHKEYLKKIKRNKILVIINTFLTSSPSLIIKTIINLINQNNLFNHILITIYETIISFLLSTIIGILISSILWWNKFLSKVLEPYLTVLNSMPKVALGPILIIWIGANINSIVFMALLISVIITIINITNAFNNTDKNKIKLMKSFNATKWQIYKMLIIPSNINTIISSLKINISMTLIGIIMGELLVSKEGIGYLIMYGSQVFNLNLVMTGIVLLCIISYAMYYIVSWIEKKVTRN
jgi:NitT/TauT family transport system permease protein